MSDKHIVPVAFVIFKSLITKSCHDWKSIRLIEIKF